MNDLKALCDQVRSFWMALNTSMVLFLPAGEIFWIREKRTPSAFMAVGQANLNFPPVIDVKSWT